MPLGSGSEVWIFCLTSLVPGTRRLSSTLPPPWPPPAPHSCLSFFAQLPVSTTCTPTMLLLLYSVIYSVFVSQRFPFLGGGGEGCDELKYDKEGNVASLRWVRSESVSECVRQWRQYLFCRNRADNPASRNPASRYCREGGPAFSWRGTHCYSYITRGIREASLTVNGSLGDGHPINLFSVKPRGALTMCPLGSLCTCIDKNGIIQGRKMVISESNASKTAQSRDFSGG